MSDPPLEPPVDPRMDPLAEGNRLSLCGGQATTGQRRTRPLPRRSAMAQASRLAHDIAATRVGGDGRTGAQGEGGGFLAVDDEAGGRLVGAQVRQIVF